MTVKKALMDLVKKQHREIEIVAGTVRESRQEVSVLREELQELRTNLLNHGSQEQDPSHDGPIPKGLKVCISTILQLFQYLRKQQEINSACANASSHSFGVLLQDDVHNVHKQQEEDGQFNGSQGYEHELRLSPIIVWYTFLCIFLSPSIDSAQNARVRAFLEQLTKQK